MFGFSMNINYSDSYASDIIRNLDHVVEYSTLPWEAIFLQKDIYLGATAKIFTIFTTDRHILCALYYMIFCTLFIACLDVILRYYTIKRQNLRSLFLLICVFLIEPYYNFNSIRFSTATLFYTWCLLKLYLENDRRFLYLIILTPIIHFGYLIMVPVPFIHKFVKDRIKIAWVILILSFIISGSSTSYFINNYVEFHFSGGIAESVSTYASEEGLATMTERYQDLSDSGNANRAFSRMIVTLRDYGIMIGAILLSYLCYKRKDEDSIRLMTLIILMFSMANIASSADNGDRFIFTTDVFVIYYLFYLVYKDKKENVYGLSGYGSFVINILFTITAIYGLSYIMVTRATYNYTQLLLGNVISAYIFNN